MGPRTRFIVRNGWLGGPEEAGHSNVQPSFAFAQQPLERTPSLCLPVRVADYLIDQLSPCRDNKHSFD